MVEARCSTRRTPKAKGVNRKLDLTVVEAPAKKVQKVHNIDIDELMNTFVHDTPGSTRRDDKTDEATDKPPATDGITDEKCAAMLADLASRKKGKHLRVNVRLAGLVPSGYLKESKYGTSSEKSDDFSWICDPTARDAMAEARRARMLMDQFDREHSRRLGL